MPRLLWTSLPAAALVILAGINSSAMAVTMVDGNGYTESWVTAADWSDNQSAHAGADYVVGVDGTGAAYNMRSPNDGGATHTFPGDSLTLDGGQMYFKGRNPTSTTIVVADLRLRNGGTLVNATADTPVVILDGKVTFDPSSTNFVYTAGDTNNGARHIVISAPTVGAGTVRMFGLGSVTLSNTNNTFSGTWLIGGIGVTYAQGATVSNSSSLVTTFNATNDGALGVNANVVLSDYSRFDVDYDWTTAGLLQIEPNAVVVLDQNLTVGALTIDGVSLGAGTYSYGDLNSNYDAFFADGGSSSITVIPEPATLALVTLGGMMMLGRRRCD